MGDTIMKRIIWILLAVLVLPAFAITAGEVSALHDELLVLMDKYTWTEYTDPYTGETVTVTPQMRAIIKQNCIDAYTAHKNAVLDYAVELGIIEAR